MLNILDQIGQWIKEFLIECITGNLSGLFDQVNEAVGDVAADVGKTPQDWNAGVFSMIRSLSDNVIVPIAGIILTFVLCYELISMITEKNNMHDFDTFNIFKWIFKVFVATYLVSHTFDITMAIFELSQNVVRQSAGVITGNTSIQFDAVMGSLTAQLETMGNGELFGLLVETVLIRITTPILSVCVMLVLVGRMVEILYLLFRGRNPFCHHDQPGVGTDGEQLPAGACGAWIARSFYHGMYSHLFCPCVKYRERGEYPRGNLELCRVYAAFMLLAFKTSSISRSIFNAH